MTTEVLNLEKEMSDLVICQIDADRGEYPHEWVYDKKRDIVRKILGDSSHGKHTIKFNPMNKYWGEKMEFEIEAYHVPFDVWVVLKTLIASLEGVPKDPDERSFYFKSIKVNGEERFLLSKEELDLLEIRQCVPRGEVSSTETIYGNHYDSNADVTGTMLGGISVCMDFLYLEHLDCYVVVEGEYYCL